MDFNVPFSSIIDEGKPQEDKQSANIITDNDSKAFQAKVYLFS